MLYHGDLGQLVGQQQLAHTMLSRALEIGSEHGVEPEKLGRTRRQRALMGKRHASVATTLRKLAAGVEARGGGDEAAELREEAAAIEEGGEGEAGGT